MRAIEAILFTTAIVLFFGIGFVVFDGLSGLSGLNIGLIP